MPIDFIFIEVCECSPSMNNNNTEMSSFESMDDDDEL